MVTYVNARHPSTGSALWCFGPFLKGLVNEVLVFFLRSNAPTEYRTEISVLKNVDFPVMMFGNLNTILNGHCFVSTTSSTTLAKICRKMSTRNLLKPLKCCKVKMAMISLSLTFGYIFHNDNLVEFLHNSTWAKLNYLQSVCFHLYFKDNNTWKHNKKEKYTNLQEWKD